jgi:hypothetical protein
MAKEKINKQIGIRVTALEQKEIENVFSKAPRSDFRNKNAFLRKALMTGVTDLFTKFSK